MQIYRCLELIYSGSCFVFSDRQSTTTNNQHRNSDNLNNSAAFMKKLKLSVGTGQVQFALSNLWMARRHLIRAKG